jgi:putative endonuclease
MMKEIGTLGEQLVARWLQLKNHDLLEYNWHCRWGEIDLIAQDQTSQAIAFVEVKTRRAYNWDADGLLSVDPNKQQKLIKTASLFLSKHPLLAELPCRFDVALVSYQFSVPKSLNINSDLAQILLLDIGQTVTVAGYQLTLKDYLAAAFD